MYQGMVLKMAAFFKSINQLYVKKPFYLNKTFIRITPIAICSAILLSITSAFCAEPDTNMATLLYNKARDYYKEKQYDSSYYYFTKARKIYLSDENHEKATDCINKIGCIQRRQHRFDEALKTFNNALDDGMKYLGANHQEIANIFHNIAITYFYISEYNQAIYYEEQAVNIWKNIHGSFHNDIAKGYLNIGVFYRNSGRNDKAIRYYHKALEIQLKILGENHPNVATNYNNISIYYESRGDFDRALEYCNNAIQICLNREAVDYVDLAKKYNNLGKIYDSKGDTIAAYENFSKALELRLKYLAKNDPDVAESYSNVGKSLKTKKKYKEALKNLYRAVTIWEKLKKSDITYSYLNIANVYFETGDTSTALEYNNKALNVLKDFYGDVHPQIAHAYSNLSHFYLKMGLFNDAIRCNKMAQTANILDHTVLDEKIQMQILEEQASIYKARFVMESNDSTDLIESIKTYKSITTHVDNLRRSYKSKGSMLKLSESVSKILTEAVRIAYLTYEVTNNHKYLEDAFYFAEKNRSNVLVEAILESRSQTYSGILDQLINKEKEIRLKLQECEQQLQNERFKKEKRNESLIDSLDLEFKVLNNTYDSIIKVFENNHSTYYLLKYNTTTLSTASVRKKLSPDEALIEYVVSDSLLFIMSVTNSGFNIKKIKIDSLNQLINDFHYTLRELSVNRLNQQTINDFSQQASTFYKLLIFPVEMEIAGKDLILIPDGLLAYIPFEVLLTNTAKQKFIGFKDFPYLMMKHTISYGNSATIQFDLLPTLKCKAEKTFLGVAPFTMNEDLLYDPLICDSVLLQSLPSSKTEVEEISRMLGGSYLTDTAATLLNFIRKAPDNRILHIATHGIINNRHPLESCLIFYSKKDSEEKTLKIQDLFTMNLNAELAVLSACNTGFGKLENGEGIMSLARGFSYSGVPGVAMTLWNVSDKSTSAIMETFYNYLIKGYSKSKALQQAKLDYIANCDMLFASPYYWGGFIFIGNYDSLSISNSNNYKHFYWLLFVLPIIGLLLYIRKKNNSL